MFTSINSIREKVYEEKIKGFFQEYAACDTLPRQGNLTL